MRKKVLIVGSSEIHLVSDLLTSAGYLDASFADSEQEALEVMCKEGEEIDLIVADFEKNGINGVALADKIAAQFKKMPKIILIVVAGRITKKQAGLNISHIFHRPFSLYDLPRFYRAVAE